jgi:hypothetical protein
MTTRQYQIPGIGHVSEALARQYQLPGVGHLYDSTPGGATTITLNGPSSGAVNAASTNFNIGVDVTPITGTVIVTPASNHAGTFSPTTVSLTTGSPSATCTFTPTVSGVHTISCTNNGSLANPATLSYTVKPAVTVRMCIAPNDGTAAGAASSLKWAWFDSTDPSSFSAPTDKGSTGAIDGSGNFTVALPNSTLTGLASGVGWLLVTNSNGTVGQNPAANGASTPAAVT